MKPCFSPDRCPCGRPWKDCPNSNLRKQPKGDWASRFGAKRRALDRAILAEVEAQIAPEASREPEDGHLGYTAVPHGPASKHPPAASAEAYSMRQTIARMFGRPAQ